MLNIYIGKLNKKLASRYIKFNDAWFNMNTMEIDFNSKEVRFLLRAIDRTHYMGDCLVESSFQKGCAVNVSGLSSGCKTAINIHTFRDKIFNLAECGNNALSAIARLDNGNCYMSYFRLIHGIKKPIKIIADCKKEIIVNDISELDNALECIDWGY